MLRHLEATIPRQTGHQSVRQALHRTNQGGDHGRRVLPRYADELHVARGAFDKRRDVRVARAREEIAFPMPWHGAVLDTRRSLGNRDGVDDLPARLPFRRRPLAASHASARSQMRGQLALEHPARLHEQAPVDRLVRQLHRRIVRIGAHEPPRDLCR